MSESQEIIKASLDEALNELETFMSDERNMRSIEEAADIMVTALREGHKIISCGNGGSLCDATHFAEELTGRYRHSRRPLPAVSVNDPAYLTCTSNDFSYDEVFSRYVEGVGQEGDVLLAISTSGTSSNILKAADAAKEKGMKTVALTSSADNDKPESNNPLAAKADVSVCAPRTKYSDRIQEIHIKVIHILIQLIEAGL